MGFADKARNRAEKLTGAAREKFGDVTDNERLEAEGATQRTEAQAKQAGENVKDAGRDIRDAFTR